MGPCAKKHVVCRIYSPDGKWVEGTNECENPQKHCPRLPGESYDKCHAICRQTAHAEINALRYAQSIFGSTKGCKGFLKGHSYVCNSCGNALSEAGLESITIVFK